MWKGTRIDANRPAACVGTRCRILLQLLTSVRGPSRPSITEGTPHFQSRPLTERWHVEKINPLLLWSSELLRILNGIGPAVVTVIDSAIMTLGTLDPAQQWPYPPH